MAVARADFLNVYRRLVSALNAGVSSSFTAVLDDPRRSAGELFAAVLAGDDEVCTLRAEAEGGSFRTLFLSDTADLQHGDTLPDRLGPITQVKIQHVSAGAWRAGKFDKGLSLADIERWRDNTGSIYGAAHDAANSSLSGYYIVLGDEIFFTGHRAKAKVATHARQSWEVADGQMNSGSAVLNSASAPFLISYIGWGVIVYDAGANGAPLVSRVEGYSSATAVTLRDANASGGAVSGKRVVSAKLQAPQSDEDAVLAFAVSRQVKRGDNPPFAELWVRAAENYRARIKGGEETLPKLELAQAA